MKSDSDISVNAFIPLVIFPFSLRPLLAVMSYSDAPILGMRVGQRLSNLPIVNNFFMGTKAGKGKGANSTHPTKEPRSPIQECTKPRPRWAASAQVLYLKIRGF